jgi:anti-anti-sigma factor
MLEVEVADDGRWDDTRALVPDRGRGLAIAYGFVDELSVEHDDRGTRARIRHRLTSPVSMLRSLGPIRHDPDRRELEVDADHDRVHVSGDLDEDGAAQLEQVLARVSRGATRKVSLDLDGVRFLSSAAVRVLLDARDAGAVHLLARPGSAAQQVLDLAQLPYDTDGRG